MSSHGEYRRLDLEGADMTKQCFLVQAGDAAEGRTGVTDVAGHESAAYVMALPHLAIASPR